MDNNKVTAYANRLVDAVRNLENISTMTQFSLTLDGTRYRFYTNRSKNNSTLGWYEVQGTSPEPDFSDCVCMEANKLLRDYSKRPPESHSNTYAPEADEDDSSQKSLESSLKSMSKKKRSGKSKEGKDSAPSLFFSVPKSTAEDLFNVMYSSYLEGMNKEIRLYSGYTYLVFDTLAVRIESECSDPRAAVLEKKLNELWEKNKPTKMDYTLYEILRESGVA